MRHAQNEGLASLPPDTLCPFMEHFLGGLFSRPLSQHIAVYVLTETLYFRQRDQTKQTTTQILHHACKQRSSKSKTLEIEQHELTARRRTFRKVLLRWLLWASMAMGCACYEL